MTATSHSEPRHATVVITVSSDDPFTELARITNQVAAQIEDANVIVEGHVLFGGNWWATPDSSVGCFTAGPATRRLAQSRGRLSARHVARVPAPLLRDVHDVLALLERRRNENHFRM
jgi:hypothetical protein